MNNKELFTNFYNDLYKNILDEYFLEIDKYIKQNKSKTTILGLLLTIIPIGLLWYLYFNIKKYIIVFIIMTIIYIILINLFTKMRYKDNNKQIIKQIKYKILDDFITLVSGNDNSKVMPNNRISKDSFQKARLFNLDNVLYTGANYIQTTINDKALVIADMNIYTLINKTKEEYFYIGNKKFKRTYQTKKKKDIFKGCYIGSEMLKRNSNLIQVIPNTLKDNLINNKINKYYDLCDYELKLENLEFSKKYSVYSNNEIKARMILTLTMMEEINKLDKIIKNKKYIIFKSDDRYSVFIENITLEEILDNNITIERNTDKELNNLYNIYNEVSKLFELAHTINNSK